MTEPTTPLEDGSWDTYVCPRCRSVAAVSILAHSNLEQGIECGRKSSLRGVFSGVCMSLWIENETSPASPLHHLILGSAFFILR